jgi:integrase
VHALQKQVIAMGRSARISLAVVKSLQPGEVVHDADLKGFGVRRRQATTSYFVLTRINGRLRWFTIGEHGSPWTPDSARKEAQDALYLARKGVAHDADRQRRKQQNETFADNFDRFITEHGQHLKPRTKAEYIRIGERNLKPRFGRMRIEEITKGDVLKAHEAWGKYPRAANHALMVLSKFMSWSEDHGRRAGLANPCRKIKKYKETRRDRYLRDDEVMRIGKTLAAARQAGEFDPFTLAALEMLMFTGARLSEILTLKWSYIDRSRGVAFLPDSKTGGKTLMLNPPAVAVLERLPILEGNPYVIVGKKPGSHLVNLQKPWRALRQRANLSDVRIHDLRHSFASFAADTGGSLEVVGQVLGHTRMDTTAGYVHLFDRRPQELSTATANRIAGLLRSGAAGPVAKKPLWRVRSRQGAIGKPAPAR